MTLINETKGFENMKLSLHNVSLGSTEIDASKKHKCCKDQTSKED